MSVLKQCKPVPLSEPQVDSMSRRTFLFSATATAFLIVSSCGFGNNRLSEEDKQELLRMARLLYPHDSLADEVYTEVLHPLRDRAEEDSALGEALRAGLAELDRVAGRDWHTATAEDQVRDLQQIEDSPFFETVQNAVRTQLYEHPEVWRLIGYGGSSVEHGGYLHRGFDDINWLPED